MLKTQQYCLSQDDADMIILFDPLKLEGEVFEPLKDENILKNFELFHGIITWNNGEIDIAPETVYYESYAYDSVIKKCL